MRLAGKQTVFISWVVISGQTLCCNVTESEVFQKALLKFSVVLVYAASPFIVEDWSLVMFSFCSLLERVLEAFHFDHETLEKQLVTIDNQGEISAPDCRNTTSNCSKCS